MRAALLLAVCGVLLCGCGAAPLPRSTLVLGHRIGAVSFGERRDRVDAALGRGVSKSPDRLRGQWIFYPRAALYVGYYRYEGEGRVGVILTHSSRYKTASGVGVGTTLDELRKRVNVVCNSGGFVDECTYGASAEAASQGHPGTWFGLDYNTKRVTRIYITVGH